MNHCHFCSIGRAVVVPTFLVFLLGGCITSSKPSLQPMSKSSPTEVTPHMHGQNDFARGMTKSMADMDRDMAAAPMTGDADHDFASMMIPHHQGAIDMARGELQYGKDPVMKRLAQEIIVTQQSEIEAMHRQLNALADTKPATTNHALTAMSGSSAPTAVSSRDRVYTADQTSNTVSVIDPSTNLLLGVIRLGEPLPASISPLYKGELLVHGLGFSPDHKTLAVISIGSNSVTFIDTATNKAKGHLYLGRSPHEAFFTPDGSELWVSVRGENYVAIVDAATMKETSRITVANGPGMVMFRPDGKYAFVCSSFEPILSVVDVKSHAVVATVKQPSPFSPNIAVSADGREVWLTLKDSGKVQVIEAEKPFATLAVLETGPITNHVNLVDNANGHFAYVTVGALNQVKVFKRGDGQPQPVATIETGDLPHGLWPSGDGSRVYVGLENGDAVQAIDTLTNKVIATIKVGQLPQALVYVPGAVPEGRGDENLVPLGQAAEATHLSLVAPDGKGDARASIVINGLGLVDQLQIAASGLKPGQEYQLWLADSVTAPVATREPLAKFKASASGSGIGQAIGPIRKVVNSPAKDSGIAASRSLIVTAVGSDEVFLASAAK